jgi:ABC-2 type transport system permease protein
MKEKSWRAKTMSKAFAIYKKEVMSLFVSPIAYVSIALFLLLVSLMVTNTLYMADMRDVFATMASMMIFVIPMATMKVLSEETRSGTNELLMTSPVSLTSIVLGKFFAVMTLIFAIFLLTGEYVILIAKYGKPDWGPIFTGYLGLFLLSGAFVSIGVFASSLTKSQFVAAVVTFVVILFFLLIDSLPLFGMAAMSEILTHLSLIGQYEDFYKGLLNLTHVIFYLGFISVFLFLAVRSLDARRW